MRLAAALLALVLLGCGPNGVPGTWEGGNTASPFLPFRVIVRNRTSDDQRVVFTCWNNSLRPVSAKIPAGSSVEFLDPFAVPDGFSIYSNAWSGQTHGAFLVWDRSQYAGWLVVDVDLPTGVLTGSIRAH